jgi:hypothetical protein
LTILVPVSSFFWFAHFLSFLPGYCASFEGSPYASFSKHNLFWRQVLCAEAILQCSKQQLDPLSNEQRLQLSKLNLAFLHMHANIAGRPQKEAKESEKADNPLEDVV